MQHLAQVPCAQYYLAQLLAHPPCALIYLVHIPCATSIRVGFCLCIPLCIHLARKVTLRITLCAIFSIHAKALNCHHSSQATADIWPPLSFNPPQPKVLPILDELTPPAVGAVTMSWNTDRNITRQACIRKKNCTIVLALVCISTHRTNSVALSTEYSPLMHDYAVIP